MRRNKTALLLAGIVLLVMIGGISVMSVKHVSGQGGAEGAASGGLSFVLGARAKLRNVIELPLSEADTLTLAYGSKNIKVYPSEKDAIVIEEYLYSDAPEAKANVSWPKEKEVMVTGGKSRSFVIFGFFGGEGERIEVYVPEKSLRGLSLQTGSGNITSQTDCTRPEGSLTASAGSGNIRWKNAEAGEISIQAGSGNLNVENLKGEMRFHTGSGNITGEKLEGNMEADAGSGNVKLEDFAGSGRIGTNSGNVTVRLRSLAGDIALGAGSGNVKLELPEKTPFHFQGETGSGNIRTDFDERIFYNKKGNQAEGSVGEEPVFKVEIKTGSGNMSVKYL